MTLAWSKAALLEPFKSTNLQIRVWLDNEYNHCDGLVLCRNRFCDACCLLLLSATGDVENSSPMSRYISADLKI